MKYSWDFETEISSGNEEFILEVRCYGYHDSGVSWGPIENSYPEEGDDEWEILRVRIYDQKNKLVETIEFDELSKVEQKLIDKLFAPLIEATDLDQEKRNCFEDPDPEDY